MDIPTRPEGGMLTRLIRFSLENQLVVLFLFILVLVYGYLQIRESPVDVFPDLTAPTVVILTEAHGLSAEDTERLITVPIESTINGAGSLRRIRSASKSGISIIWAEFGWNTDIFRARQLINERLQVARTLLPKEIPPPTLAPITSIMGEIMFISLTSKKITGHRLREVVDIQLAKRIRSVRGVAQVLVIGGEKKEYQVSVDPDRLRQYDLTLSAVYRAVKSANLSASGGFIESPHQEFHLRLLGRVHNLAQLKGVVVKAGKVPVKLHQVARVEAGTTFKRGSGSLNGKPAIVVGIMKQPGVNTLELTRRVDVEFDRFEAAFPGVTIQREAFRQSHFIEAGVKNVFAALSEGILLVVAILILFLFNWRTTVISVVTIPVALLVCVIVLRHLEMTINVMTLGGMTIAIGAVVDDAIIFAENILKRLRENRIRQSPTPTLTVVLKASTEMAQSIVYATLIVMIVFVPIFFLSGVEGRLLKPLGVAFIVAIFASLVVALTLTPVLSYVLLGRVAYRLKTREFFVTRALKWTYLGVLRVSLRGGWWVLVLAIILFAGTLALATRLGSTFLPPFQEGALTIALVSLPGTSLNKSDQIGSSVERTILSVNGVVSTIRRTGRAELDEHAQGVNASEIDVVLRASPQRIREITSAIRKRLQAVPGVIISVGQPLGHRIDHMLSGSRANLAIKVFGADLQKLDAYSARIEALVKLQTGLADVQREVQAKMPQYQIELKEKGTLYGYTKGALVEQLDLYLTGESAGYVLEGLSPVNILVRGNQRFKQSVETLKQLRLKTPTGQRIMLGELAEIRYRPSHTEILRENGRRRIMISANVKPGADISKIVATLAQQFRSVPMAAGYDVVIGGQFLAAKKAQRTMLWVSLLVLVAIFLLLYLSVSHWKHAVLIMANLPFALIGGVVAVYATDKLVSIASLVGFITLFGIAVRNGIILVSRYETLAIEKLTDWRDAIIAGSLDRLNPILMTAATTGLAFIPIMLKGSMTGNEIQYPMSIVVFWGLFSSTILNLVILPVLFHKFGSRRLKSPAQTEV